jgi:hypothetical protein
MSCGVLQQCSTPQHILQKNKISIFIGWELGIIRTPIRFHRWKVFFFVPYGKKSFAWILYLYETEIVTFQIIRTRSLDLSMLHRGPSRRAWELCDGTGPRKCWGAQIARHTRCRGGQVPGGGEGFSAPPNPYLASILQRPSEAAPCLFFFLERRHHGCRLKLSVPGREEDTLGGPGVAYGFKW